MDIERSDQTGSFKSTEPSSPVSYPQAGWHSALYGFRERERTETGDEEGRKGEKNEFEKERNDDEGRKQGEKQRRITVN